MYLQHFQHHDRQSTLYTQCTARVLALYELLAEESTSGMRGDLGNMFLKKGLRSQIKYCK